MSFFAEMRFAGLALILLCACDGGDTGSSGGTSGGGGSGSTSTTSSTSTGAATCSGTHAPCSAYDGEPQECTNHGCSVNGSSCQGTPHLCEDEDSFSCGQNHGCDACAFCGPGTICVNSCLLGGVYSARTDCVETTLTCDACTTECAEELCGAGADCMEGCIVPTPGAFQCIRQP